MLKPVGYHNRTWPCGPVVLREVAGHFDVKGVSVTGSYSLHTEYAAGARKFSSAALCVASDIPEAHVRGIPQLWKSREWAVQFAAFVVELTRQSGAPEVVEVHPPFKDYCPTFDMFLDRYACFEAALAESYPGTRIVIENRHGTRYTGSKFLLNTCEDMLDLAKLLDTSPLQLELCLDVPQLFTAHYGPAPRTAEHIDRVLQPLLECRHRIASVHIWGKKPNKRGGMQAHYGTLDTWLGPDLKHHFLSQLHELFDDGRTRYLVPEVNGSQADMDAIARDMLDAGFTFC